MDVLQRSFVNLVVVKASIDELIHRFSEDMYSPVIAQPTEFVFPKQSYRASDDSPPPLLWSPDCDKGLTAFMPHVSSGDYYLAERTHSVFGMEVTCAHVTDPPSLNEFIVYSDKKRVRIVRAMKDPKWLFWQDGTPLAFEDQSLYTERLIKNRITKDRVLSYMHAWGAPVTKKHFWTTSTPAYTFIHRKRPSNPSEPKPLCG